MKSYDPRRHPSGPRIEPGGGSALRGTRRTGPIRGIVPGDDVEVARDIARLWEWHYWLERRQRRLERLEREGGGGVGNFGCFTSKVLDQEDPDLVAYFDMQESSGSLEDRSENGYTATAVGSPEYGEDGIYPSEPSLKSIEFSPTNQESSTDTFDHFRLPAAVAFGGTQEFTIEIAAVYLGVPATRQIMASAMETNNTSGWWFGIDSNSCLVGKRGGVTVTAPEAISLELGDAFHAALRFTGTKLEIVYNGQTVASVAASASITASTVAYLGRVKISSTNYYFDDRMAAAVFWSRPVVNAELAARFLCLTRTASGDPDEIGTDPDGRPPTTVYTLTGNAFAGAAEVLHRVSDNPNGGYVRIPRYNFWWNRGWRLLARGAFADLDGGSNTGAGVASDDVDAFTQETETLVPEGSYSSYDFTSNWVRIDRSFSDQPEEATVTFYTYLLKSTSGGATPSVGTQTVQLYWVDADEADQIIQQQNIPAGSATDDILEWDGGQWVPDKLQNANVDDAAAILHSKIASVGVRANRTSNQAIADSTLTAIDLTGTESFDTDAFHDTGTNPSRLTVPAGRAGKYLIMGGFRWDTNAAGSIRAIQIFLNGTTELTLFYLPPNASGVVMMAFTIAQLAVGDYVEMRAFQDSGGSRNVDVSGGACHFEMMLQGT